MQRSIMETQEALYLRSKKARSLAAIGDQETMGSGGGITS